MVSFSRFPTPHPASPTGSGCTVYRADAMRVKLGVNHGEPLAAPDDICPGDLYQLDRRASPLHLTTEPTGHGFCVAEGSDIGAPGDSIDLLARYTLMAEDGNSIELSLLALRGHEAGLFIQPLSPIGAGIEYQLLSIEEAPAAGPAPAPDPTCVSFGRGTRIALADCGLRAIETLRPGDLVLTRDHGPQPLRWIGRATLRAIGAVAPVVITAGALGNAGDLVLSQHHRIFLYQRDRMPGVLTAEVLIQARHLIDDDAIFCREGGYVEYFSLIFDRHEIVYAEGIPVESLQVTEAVLDRLPAELSVEVRARFPGLRHAQHIGTEAARPATPARTTLSGVAPGQSA